MNSLHPHWQSTGDDDSSSGRHEPVSTGVSHVAIVPASRLPAAIVGMVVVTLVGITLAGAWKPLLGQVAGSGSTSSSAASGKSSSKSTAVEVHITKEGFKPARIVVKPGQQITWINDQSIPHILTSQTLRNDSGSYLNTPAIFPKGKTSFRVGSKEADREHTYGSTTDKNLQGTVVVSKSGEAAAPTDPCVANGGTGIFGGLDDIPLPTGRGTTGDCLPSSSSSVAAAAVSSAPEVVLAPASSSAPAPEPEPVLPAAPVEPPISDGTPLDAIGSIPDLPAAPILPPAAQVIPENNYAPVAPHPEAQPDTGPGLWVVGFMSISTLAVVTRKYFRKLA